MLSSITPLVLTFNEEDNIERTIQKLQWASKIVVIDSFSKDRTLNILRSFSNVEVHFREFDTFADQCNFGLSLITTDWVLSMDADYVLTDDFIEELKKIIANPRHDSYLSSFRFCVFGRPLKSDNTTPRKVLYKKELAKYENDGHAHRVLVEGSFGYFTSYILHDDRKPLSRWLQSQDKYLIQEANKIKTTPYAELDFRDKIRTKRFLSPLVIFFYCLFVKKMLFEGWHGWHYTLQRTLVETLLSIRLTEQKLKK